MSTNWNWSWVKPKDTTAKESGSITANTGTVFSFRQPANGQIPSKAINAGFNSVASNLHSLWSNWITQVRPILDSLPAGNRDQRWSTSGGIGLSEKIDALTFGLQGTTLFVFNDADAVKAEGRYWNSTDLRPKTIAEAMEDVHARISSSLSSTNDDETTDADVQAIWYAVGNSYENPVLVSAPSSLDVRATTLEAYMSQTNEDIYGVAAGYGYGYGSPLPHSLAANIDELLKIHGVVGWQADPSGASHDALTISLDEAYNIGNTITADTAAVIINSAAGINALELGLNTSTSGGLQVSTTNSTSSLIEATYAGNNLLDVKESALDVGYAGWGNNINLYADQVIVTGSTKFRSESSANEFANQTRFYSKASMLDDKPLNFGTGEDAALIWDTSQTIGRDTLVLGLDESTATNNLIICQKSDIGTDFEHVTSPNNCPTVYIHSAAAAAQEYLGLQAWDGDSYFLNGKNDNHGFVHKIQDAAGKESMNQFKDLNLDASGGANDEQTHEIPGHGIGFVSFVSENEPVYYAREYAMFVFSQAFPDGATTITLLHNSANISTSDVADKFCIIGGNSGSIKFENNFSEAGKGFFWTMNNETQQGERGES